MKRGIDRDAAPSALEANRWKDDERADGINIYMPGLGATPEQPTWTKEKVDYLAAMGFEFWLASPGPQSNKPDRLNRQQGVTDALACAVYAEEYYGFPRNYDDRPADVNTRTTIVADIEYDTWYSYRGQSAEYVGGFCDTLWANGYYPAVYSQASFCKFTDPYITVPSKVWICEWPNNEYADWIDIVDPYQLASIAGHWNLNGERMLQGVNQKQRGIDLNLTDWVLTIPQPLIEDEHPPLPDALKQLMRDGIAKIRVECDWLERRIGQL